MTVLTPRLASLGLLAVALNACAGAPVRPLINVRDIAVSPEQARVLTRVVLVPVELRQAMVPEARGDRWDDIALLNDDLLMHVLADLARSLNAGGVHQTRIGEHYIIVSAEPEEPAGLLWRWAGRTDTDTESSRHVANADAVLELAWASFPVRNLVVAARLVDPRSGQLLGRGYRTTLEAGSPPKLEHVTRAFRSAVRGLGLSLR